MQASKFSYSIRKDNSSLNFCVCISPSFYYDRSNGTPIALYNMS